MEVQIRAFQRAGAKKNQGMTILSQIAENFVVCPSVFSKKGILCLFVKVRLGTLGSYYRKNMIMKIINSKVSTSTLSENYSVIVFVQEIRFSGHPSFRLFLIET